jgi:hypothetical protein
VLLTIDEQIQAVETLLGHGPLPESQARHWLIRVFFGSLARVRGQWAHEAGSAPAKCLI